VIDKERTMSRIDNLEYILLTYGANNQILKAVEELTELTEVLIKMTNKGESLDHLLDEMADVYIMMEQEKIACCIQPEQLDEQINEKINRQLRRIKEAENDSRGCNKRVGVD
jgi:hypothetical protein